MATFDFIASDELRAGLEKDAAELIVCMQAGAWKSAHVLAASLIQAILVDYLASSGKGGEEELRRLPFSELLDLSRAEQVLSSRTVDLAHFIRPYGDYLSPSSMRLQATTDETSARIAQALLEIVINEVSSHIREHYRYTAEQIVAKLQSDPTSETILGHLLSKISRVELERLLIDLLPKAYFDHARLAEPRSEETLKRLAQCYRLGFENAPVNLKRAVAKHFLSILENESEYIVQSYESFFFRGSDVEFLADTERAIVKTHFFASLAKQASVALVDAAAGMGRFLTSEADARTFFVPLVMNLLEQKDEALAAAIIKRIREEFALLSEENRRSVGNWIARLKWAVQREGGGATAVLERLEAALERETGRR